MPPTDTENASLRQVIGYIIKDGETLLVKQHQARVMTCRPAPVVGNPNHVYEMVTTSVRSNTPMPLYKLCSDWMIGPITADQNIVLWTINGHVLKIFDVNSQMLAYFHRDDLKSFRQFNESQIDMIDAEQKNYVIKSQQIEEKYRQDKNALKQDRTERMSLIALHPVLMKCETYAKFYEYSLQVKGLQAKIKMDGNNASAKGELDNLSKPYGAAHKAFLDCRRENKCKCINCKKYIYQ